MSKKSDAEVISTNSGLQPDYEDLSNLSPSLPSLNGVTFFPSPSHPQAQSEHPPTAIPLHLSRSININNSRENENEDTAKWTTDDGGSLGHRHGSHKMTLLSFLISPVGYRWLGFGRLSCFKKKDKNISWKHHNSTNRATVAAKKLATAMLVSSEEYVAWFESKRQKSPMSSVFSSYPDDLSGATRAGVRGFVAGYLAGTITDVLLPALLKLRLKGLLQRLKKNHSSRSLGLSIGFFALVYKLVFRYMAMLLDGAPTVAEPHRRDCETQLKVQGPTTPRTMAMLCKGKGPSMRRFCSAVIAALVASPTFALIPQQTRRLAVALYSLTYAGEIIYAALKYKGYLEWIPAWCNIWIITSLSWAVIVHSFTHHTELLAPEALTFIFSLRSPYLIRPPQFDPAVYGPYPSARDLFKAMAAYAGTSPKSASAFEKLSIPSSCVPVLKSTENMNYDSMYCRFFHANTSSCKEAILMFTKRQSLYAFKIYLKLEALMFLVRDGRAFHNGVMSYVKEAGIRIVSDTICLLGAFITAFSLYCVFEHVLPREFLPTKRHYLSGAMTGLWPLILPPKRQSVLSLFALRLALKTIWNHLVEAKYVRNIKYVYH
ncbi:hypothetical protein BX616_005757 [Lobosporangium transversale]|nr:hypothetical protein BX616_005757 [Lobosporangium transversale]